MNPVEAPIAALSTKVCACCTERKPLQSFSPDASRSDGRSRACKPCRAAAIARQRAAADADGMTPAPKPTGRGPERIEPGAVLMALEELSAHDDPLVVLDCALSDVPRELRAHAVRAVDGRLVLPKRVLVDWVRALRRRVGEYALRAQPQDLGLTAREVDAPDECWAHSRQRCSDN